MITAVFSDVHSNLPALKAVLKDAEEHQANEYWFLGDLVGYCPQPVQVFIKIQELEVNLLKKGISLIRVQGNQDLCFTNYRGKESVFTKEFDGINGIASSALAKNKSASAQIDLAETITKWLKKAPLWDQPREGIYVAHGIKSLDRKCSWGEYMDRTGRADLAWSILKKRLKRNSSLKPARLLLVGHDHCQFAWRRKPRRKGATWEPLYPDFGLAPEVAPNAPHFLGQVQAQSGPDSCPLPLGVTEPVSLITENNEGLTIVCVGSVGLARDGLNIKPGWAWAKYAIIDWHQKGGRVEFRFVPYETRSLIEELKNGKYPVEIIKWFNIP